MCTIRLPAATWRKKSGFTLIEIVIVMAILAILALMAAPALYGNTARQQIRDSLQLADFAEKAVAQYFLDTGLMPVDNEAAKLPPANKIVGNFVSAVTVKDGAVTLKFGNSAHAKLMGKQLTYRPAYSEVSRAIAISWVCANRPVPTEMKAAGTNATDLAPDLLPVDCR